MLFKTVTKIIKANATNVIDFSNVTKVKDFAFFNTGGSDATINLNGFDLAIPAEGNRTFSGYENGFKTDRIESVTFSGGTGVLEIQYTIDITPTKC